MIKWLYLQLKLRHWRVSRFLRLSSCSGSPFFCFSYCICDKPHSAVAVLKTAITPRSKKLQQKKQTCSCTVFWKICAKRTILFSRVFHALFHGFSRVFHALFTLSVSTPFGSVSLIILREEIHDHIDHI